MILHTYRRQINHWMGKTIIQVSPMRSGSTLVFNILREIFPHRKVLKRHKYIDNQFKFPAVVTYRNPLDCIASSIQRFELSPTNEVIEQQVALYNRKGTWDVFKNKNNPNVLMLRYEEFVTDFEVIYRAIETFFDIDIPFQTRNEISARYQIEAIAESIENMDTFAKYDPITHWHGNHISKFKGKPFYHREFFRGDQIEYLTKIYKQFLTEFNYM